MAKTGKGKGKVTVKELHFRNDPMIRMYDRAQDWLQERGRPLLIGIGVILGALVLFALGQLFFNYRDGKAKAAFAQAFEKYNAPVITQSVTPPRGKFFPDEKQKWQDTANAFENLSRDYPGRYGTIGLYYAGVSYLRLGERDKGLQLLQQAADKQDQPTSDLARLALAENYAGNGEMDKAQPIYDSLLSSAYVPKPVVQLGLGRLYEKTGDKDKAVENYFEAAKEGRTTPAGADAEKRLSVLAPDRIKELPLPDALPQ